MREEERRRDVTSQKKRGKKGRGMRGTAKGKRRERAFPGRAAAVGSRAPTKSEAVYEDRRPRR